ncbi:hypothetical protein EIP86_010724 [Pleurotus ostreatoroseus]|nr:hypothetical protein EIP86_010724 [Pleurotus ostreatoroseus]
MSPSVYDESSVLTVSPCKLFDDTADSIASTGCDTTVLEVSMDDCPSSLPPSPFFHSTPPPTSKGDMPPRKVKFLDAVLDAAYYLDDSFPPTQAEKTLLAQLSAADAVFRALQYRSDVALAGLNREIAELEADYTQLETERIQLKADRDALREAHEAEQARVMELRRELEGIMEERDRMQDVVEELGLQLASAKESHRVSLQAQEAALVEVRTENESLHAEVMRIVDDLQTSDTALVKSQVQRSELDTKCRDLSLVLDEKDAGLTAAEKRTKALEAELTALRAQHTRASSTLSTLQSQNDTLTTQLKAQSAAVAKSANGFTEQLQDLDKQLQDQIDSRLAQAEVERALREDVRVQQDVAEAAERRADQLKAALATHELAMGVKAAGLEARVTDLEASLRDKDRVVQHTAMQSTALVKTHATAQRALAGAEAAAACARTAQEAAEGTLTDVRTERDALSAQLRAQETLTIGLEAEMTGTRARLNALTGERDEARASEAELRAMGVQMGCRIADLEEQLVEAYAEGERSVGRVEIEVEQERARRNDFQEVAQVTLEAILDEKDKLKESRNGVERTLDGVKTERDALRASHESLAKEIVELRLALKSTPGATELREAKQLVARYTQQIAGCKMCSKRPALSMKENVELSDR